MFQANTEPAPNTEPGENNPVTEMLKCYNK